MRNRMLLVLATAFLPLLVPVEAWRPRSLEAVSMETSSSIHSQRRKATNERIPVDILVSFPRGGSEESTESSDTETSESKGGLKEIVDDVEEKVVDEVEERLEDVTEAIAEKVEDFVEDVEEKAEEIVEDSVEAVEDIVEDVIEGVSGEDEDAIAFHTTDGELADGELADDEGVYTDGQNESPETAADTEVAESTAVRTAASVAVIDDDLKTVLMTDLRYTKEDVANMRPEIATEVVENKLARPTEGMPTNWYIDPEAAIEEQALQKRKRKIVIVSVAAAGAVAISLGALKENDEIEGLLEALKSIPKTLVNILVSAKDKALGIVVPKGKKPIKLELEEFKEELIGEDEDESTDTKASSIKPGTSAAAIPDPTVDRTWLDKSLTRIGGLFKTFLNAKI